ncbi:MAG: ferritin-like domain-containing protein [Deltaproteobacteria bacterium]|nr:MAG: ferritin-like domain-containing protein [Deltaproteobacteria bacterium]TMQ11625.1 MAG: ferritin-like domain-containing protein [Deltaproteobacteria bacterium]
MPAFELAAIGGPWGRRLAPRRAWLDQLPWHEPLPRADDARIVWTQTAFSEYASAAAFAEVASALLAAGAPIDLVAAAGDFVVDEIVHTEAAARVATALGGAVALEVDLTRLVRPPTPRADGAPLLAAAELVVRTSCVGEALTVPMLKLAARLAGSALIEAVLTRIVADEASHGQLGWWFLDWAAPRLDDAARAHLAGVAGDAIRAFAPLLGGSCTDSGLGVVGCDRYDPAFADAVSRAVVDPLAARGIAVRLADLPAFPPAAPVTAPQELAPAGA